jgi:hypothetical protein
LHAPLATVPDNQIPLAVDLDGTLIRSDMLWESLVRLLLESPLQALAVPIWWLQGRAHLKQQLAARVRVDPASLPYNEEFIAWLKEQKRSGRLLILATASDIAMADPVAQYVGLFDGVMASDGKTNLRHAAKLRALTERFGPRGFDYAGNSPVDLGVWAGTREAIVVNGTDRLARRAAQTTKVGKVFPAKPALLAALLTALRPHQWATNLIVFLPALMAHQLGQTTILGLAARAFVAFCLCASAVYLFNGLRDLEADRNHPTQRSRPLASGALPLSVGLMAAPGLLLAALGVALCLSPEFLAVVLGYFILAVAYAWRLKRIALLNGLVLVGLIMWRVLAGYIATKPGW